MPAWLALDGAAELEPGTLRTLAAGGADLVVANVAGTLYAYRDGCPGCLGPLGGAVLDGDLLHCPGCGRAYDLPRAGRAMDGASAPLEPVPLLRRDARNVEVALAR